MDTPSARVAAIGHDDPRVPQISQGAPDHHSIGAQALSQGIRGDGALLLGHVQQRMQD
jgi:hypothetical protein